jgi:hypothetical protein
MLRGDAQIAPWGFFCWSIIKTMTSPEYIPDNDPHLPHDDSVEAILMRVDPGFFAPQNEEVRSGEEKRIGDRVEAIVRLISRRVSPLERFAADSLQSVVKKITPKH